MKEIAIKYGWVFNRICPTCSQVRKEIYKHEKNKDWELWIIPTRNIWELKDRGLVIANGTVATLMNKLSSL
jgi:hypothetical protein